ncbi:MAG: hypothetical protein IJD26_08765 [Lachnospiraceae bacterium]|nr:hypothetical protein [Lachnospiraceae bacterium]
MKAVLTEKEANAESFPDVQMEPASESRVMNAAQTLRYRGNTVQAV